jgi:ribosomal protein S17
VHDENNYCVTGDRVIIGNCFKMSNTKAYYVKSIVKPIPRLITEKSE